MTQLEIGLRENRKGYRPGEQLAGAATWKLDRPAEALEIRLVWLTAGKGTPDARIVETHRIDRPAVEAVEPFSFKLPAEPCSFSGQLITLTWAVEIVALPDGENARAEFILSPTGREIVLTPAPHETR